MINPNGQECKYFYGDYHRGKNIEQCRFLAENELDWQEDYCAVCPVPEITQANACENMTLTPRLRKKILFLQPRVFVDAYCQKTKSNVKEPKVGCGECHPLPDSFNWVVADTESKEEPDENNPAD